MHVLRGSPSSARSYGRRGHPWSRGRGASRRSVPRRAGASGADPRRARGHREDDGLAGGARARAHAQPSRLGDAPVGGRDGARDGWAHRSAGRRLRRARRLPAGASAGGARRGAASRGRSARRRAARNGLRRCARTAAPRFGGVARSACGRRPAVAGPGHGRDAGVRAAPTERDARSAARDHAHRRARADARSRPDRGGIG